MLIQQNMGGFFSRGKVSGAELKNRKKFLKWAKQQNPRLYETIMRKIGIHNMGAANDPVADDSIWGKIVSGFQQIVPTIVQAKAQKQIFDAQLKRAKQGLAPLKTSEIAPTVRIETGVSKSTSSDIKKMMLPIGLGIAAIAAVMLLKKS